MLRLILRYRADEEFVDLITFTKEVNKIDVINLIENLKKTNEEYANEDVYKELAKLGDFTLEFIRQYEIIDIRR